MSEPVKKILAYHQSPLVLTCVQSGEIPEDFLVSVTDEEAEYISTRTTSPVEPLFYELLAKLGAAGVISRAPHVILDVHVTPAKLKSHIDGIPLALVEDPSTQEYLLQEYVEPYIQSLTRVIKKTEERFGHAHVVFLSVLPEFIDGSVVDHEIVTFGEKLLSQATHEPSELKELYERLVITRFDTHTWIGVHPKLFRTHTLRQELLDRLSEMGVEMVLQ